MTNIPSKPTKRELVKHILRSVVIGAFSWIPAQSHTPAYIVDFMEEHEVPLSPIPAYFRGRRVRKWRREVQETRLYNYGWRSSLREKWSFLSYERYFQKVDKDFSLKLLTNGFLTGLLDCLSEKNISTAQFKQTTTKIINEGVMISGGEVKAETLAVGKGAKIAKTAISAASGGDARS